MKIDKIGQYKRNYIKKEQKAILIRDKELLKRKTKSYEFPKEIILLRLDIIKDEEKRKNKRLKL